MEIKRMPINYLCVMFFKFQLHFIKFGTEVSIK